MAQMFKRWKAGGDSCSVRREMRSFGVPARRIVLLNLATMAPVLLVSSAPATAAEFAPTDAMALLLRKGEFALSEEVCPFEMDCDDHRSVYGQNSFEAPLQPGQSETPAWPLTCGKYYNKSCNSVLCIDGCSTDEIAGRPRKLVVLLCSNSHQHLK
jgi:hypothetical protein